MTEYAKKLTNRLIAVTLIITGAFLPMFNFKPWSGIELPANWLVISGFVILILPLIRELLARRKK